MSETTSTLPDALDDSTPAARHVYRILRERGDWATSETLAEETNNSQSHIRRVLRRLVEKGLVDRRTKPSAPRQYEYRLAQS